MCVQKKKELVIQYLTMAVLYIYKHHALWVPQDSFNRLITDAMMLFKCFLSASKKNFHDLKKCKVINNHILKMSQKLGIPTTI